MTALAIATIGLEIVSLLVLGAWTIRNAVAVNFGVYDIYLAEQRRIVRALTGDDEQLKAGALGMSYYITPIIGTGTRADPFRTLANSYGVSSAVIMPSGPDGHPLFTWALIVVPTGANTTAMDADTTIDKLPITSLDQTIGSLTPQQRKTFQDLGTKYSVPAVAGLTNSNTCRDALIAFGRALDANFDPAVFAAI